MVTPLATLEESWEPHSNDQQVHSTRREPDLRPTKPEDPTAICEEVEISIRRVKSLVSLSQKLGDEYKRQPRVSLKQTSDLRLQSAESVREIQERIQLLEARSEKLEAAKEKGGETDGR